MLPTGVDGTQIDMGFCFPKESTQLAHFPSVLQQYLKRWEMAVTEDNGIALNQMKSGKFRLPGRYGPREFGTHNFNNWLASAVAGGGKKWDLGQRVFIGEEQQYHTAATQPNKEANAGGAQ